MALTRRQISSLHTSLRDTLDRAPLRVRLGMVSVSAGMLAAITGFAYAGLAAVAIGGVLAATGIIVGGLKARLPQKRGSKERLLVVYEIELTDSESAQQLARLVEERSRVSPARYLVASVVDAGLSRVIVAIYSHRTEDLAVESEVFKTLVTSTVRGAKIRENNDMETEPLEVLLRQTVTGRPASPPVIHGSGASRNPQGLVLGERLDGLVREPVILTRTDVEGNIAVFGATGAGKSTTLSRIAVDAWRNLHIRVVVMDWSGEYAEKLSYAGVPFYTLNPLKEGGIDPLRVFTSPEALVSAISTSLSLSEPQEYMLMRILERSRPHRLDELVALLEEWGEDSKWDREVKKGLLRKLGSLTWGSWASAFRGEPPIASDGITVVEAYRIDGVTARRSYINFMLSMLEKLHGDTLAVIDEAHNLVPNGDGFLGLLMSEARKRGLHVAIATQSPSLLSPRLLTNANTKIIHRIGSNADLDIVRTVTRVPREVEARLPRLPTGVALIQAPSLQQPVLARIIPGQEA